MNINLMKMPVKKFMLPIGPLNGMPFATKLEALKIASKIAKFVPHPTVQAVAHTVEYGIEAVEHLNDHKQQQELAAVVNMKSFSPK